MALENCSLIILLRDYSNFFAAVDDYRINCHQSVLDDGSLLTSAYLGEKHMRLPLGGSKFSLITFQDCPPKVPSTEAAFTVKKLKLKKICSIQ